MCTQSCPSARDGSLCYITAWNLTPSNPFQDWFLQGAGLLLNGWDQTPCARAQRPQGFGGRLWSFCLYLWREKKISPLFQLSWFSKREYKNVDPRKFLWDKEKIQKCNFTNNGIMVNTTKPHLIYFHIPLPRLQLFFCNWMVKLLPSWMGTAFITTGAGQSLGGVCRK